MNVPTHSASLASSLLLDSMGVSPSRHTVLRENLTHYNAQVETPVSDVWDLSDARMQHKPDDRRWLGKLDRDVRLPYDDQQVVAKYEALDGDLRSLLGTRGAKFPSKLFVAGGINQGRFGGNSDLDVLGEGLLSARACGNIAALPGWKVHQTLNPQGQPIIQSVSSPAGVHAEFLAPAYFDKLSNWFGKHFEVDVAKARQGDTGVKEAIIQGFESKGYEVEWNDDGLSLHGTGPGQTVVEEARPYPLNFGPGYKIEQVTPRAPRVLDWASEWLTRKKN